MVDPSGYGDVEWQEVYIQSRLYNVVSSGSFKLWIVPPFPALH